MRLAPLLLALVVGCSPARTATPAPPADVAPVGADLAAEASPAEVLAANPASSGEFGLLVMAHGGDAAWNAAVEAEVDELRHLLPVELAFGMANPRTLQAGADALEARGVTRAAVIRLFLSGESFREQTDFYLGMSDTPPAQFVLMGPAAADPASRLQLEHGLQITTHDHGLLETRLAHDVLVERAVALSEDPGQESVILVGHGMGDDRADAAVRANLDPIAASLRDLGFAQVTATTLREDWPEKRAVAEAEIRAFVEGEAAAGRRVLVVPARLSGFGPYAEVLEGLAYAAGDGILPDPALSDWILRTGRELGCREGWVGSEACER